MTLFEQLLEPTLLRTTEVTQRFAIAEGVARLVAQDVLSESIEQRYSTINRVLIFATGITSNEAARPTLAVLLLVFSSMINFPLRILDLKTILSYQLYLLKDPDLFTQDICCMGICHLYRKSKDIIDSPKQLPDDTSNGDQARTATSYIVREVIATLSRERRFQQPVGMAVAGETSTATNNNNNANVEGTTIGVGINNNGQINTLALAASLAAAELNLSQDQLNSLQQESNAPDRFETDYGVYTLVCKVARKVYQLHCFFEYNTNFKLFRLEITR